MRIDIGQWHIRSYRPADADAVARYAGNPNVWRNLRDAHPYTVPAATAWIRHSLRQRPETNFAIASEEEVIGGIGLGLQGDVHRDSAEVGYWLGEPYWGQGIATVALCAITEYAFTELDLNRLFAYVFEWNPASARVLEKAGYHCEGRLRKSAVKNGRTVDQLLYAIIRA